MKYALHAEHYADQARQYEVLVQERRQLARNTFLVRFACPELARKITPGQFVMLRPVRGDDPLLGRAFAMYDVSLGDAKQPQGIVIVFHIVGKMTRFLANVSAGDALAVWGPLGNGFSAEPTGHLVMVAGGIGQTPFLALAKEYLGVQTFGHRPPSSANRVSLCYGARSADLLAGVEDFEAVGVDVRLATDDGSAGHHGFVTTLLQRMLDKSNSSGSAPRVVCCGPEAMMEAVAKHCLRTGIPCQVSLETPMACGMGICFSCVTRVIQPDGSWDFKRTCVDGPVFEARRLAW